MPPSQKIAIVTGANKGIGFAIVRNLALQYPKSPLSSGGSESLLVYVTARSQERGQRALEELQNDKQLKNAKALVQHGGSTVLKFKELDIGSEDSIHEFKNWLKSEHGDGVDVVINNAAIAMRGFDLNVVKETLRINYFGTLNITQALLPLVRDNGRIVNVASTSGRLASYSAALQRRFITASQTSVSACSDLMNEFTEAVAERKEKEAGWPSAAYGTSKAGVIAFSKILAKEEAAKGRGVGVEVCCPGYTQTDMTRGGGTKTADEGANTPVLLGLGVLGGEPGAFWQHEKKINW